MLLRRFTDIYPKELYPKELARDMRQFSNSRLVGFFLLERTEFGYELSYAQSCGIPPRCCHGHRNRGC